MKEPDEKTSKCGFGIGRMIGYVLKIFLINVKLLFLKEIYTRETGNVYVLIWPNFNIGSGQRFLHVKTLIFHEVSLNSIYSAVLRSYVFKLHKS